MYVHTSGRFGDKHQERTQIRSERKIRTCRHMQTANSHALEMVLRSDATHTAHKTPTNITHTHASHTHEADMHMNSILDLMLCCCCNPFAAINSKATSKTNVVAQPTQWHTCGLQMRALAHAFVRFDRIGSIRDAHSLTTITVRAGRKFRNRGKLQHTVNTNNCVVQFRFQFFAMPQYDSTNTAHNIRNISSTQPEMDSIVNTEPGPLVW